VIGSLPVALVVEGLPALVVGGDDEADDKAARLVEAGARVTVVAEAVVPALARRAERAELRWFARAFADDDVRGAAVVVVTPLDPNLGARVRRLTRRGRAWLCAIDQPALCDFVQVATVRAGPVQVALASGGTAPALLGRLREGLVRALDGRFAAFAERLGRARETLAGSDRAARRAAMAAWLEGFALDVSVRYPAWEAARSGPPGGHVDESRVMIPAVGGGGAPDGGRARAGVDNPS
jgi:precorrin-2 dehydrogenase/sirohydrochlorin ferrochelatase